MVGAAMALVHLRRARADGEAEQLVAEADAEQRLARLQQLADHRHRIVAGRRRIAGAVGEEDAVGLVRHHLLEAGGGGEHGHPRAGIGEVAEDVALGAVIDRDDVRAPRLPPPRPIAFAELPEAAGPAVHLSAGTSLARSMPSSPGQARAFLSSASMSNSPFALCAITPLGAPSMRILRVSARVSTPARPIRPFERIHSSKPLAARKLLGCGDVLAHHAAERPGIVRLQILIIGADIADMREGEGDDLRGVGGIGHHLLIAGHRGVEADLADRLALGAEAAAPDDRPVGQDQYARRPVRRRRGFGVGHWGGHSFGGSAMSLRLGR